MDDRELDAHSRRNKILEDQNRIATSRNNIERDKAKSMEAIAINLLKLTSVSNSLNGIAKAIEAASRMG